MKITCVYRNKDYELCNIKFNDYRFFGEWVANNVTEITLIDVIAEEE